MQNDSYSHSPKPLHPTPWALKPFFFFGRTTPMTGITSSRCLRSRCLMAVVC